MERLLINQTNLNILITINAATLGAIIVFGIKLVRFISKMEFRVDVMWEDYERRTEIDREFKINAHSG